MDGPGDPILTWSLCAAGPEEVPSSLWCPKHIIPSPIWASLPWAGTFLFCHQAAPGRQDVGAVVPI